MRTDSLNVPGAGPRCRRRPAFLSLPSPQGIFLASLGLSVAAFAQQGAGGATTRCDELPEMRQALCWMVVACGALAEEGRREECYRVAADSLQHGGSPDDEVPAATSDVDTAVVETDGRQQTPVAVNGDEAPPPSPTRVGGPSRVTARTVTREVLDIPNRFSALVTARRKLVRNRQLLVLDGKLLFETDNADTSGIDRGEEVDVVKASSLRGRSYQITGPSKRSVTGLRIRCERLDLSAGNRRKCAMLPGGAAAAN